MLSYEEALQNIISSRTDFGTESMSLEQAFGRVLAEDVFADRDYPPFNRSAMDGYAIKAEDILNKRHEKFSVVGEIFAGDNGLKAIRSGEAVKIMTGAPVPDGANAVIRKEDAVQTNGHVSFIVDKLKLYHNIALRGEDIQINKLVIPIHTQIDFRHLSVLASLGRDKIQVVRIPKVAVFSTGNEIQQITKAVGPHQIRDSNSYSISGFLQNYSITPSVRKIVKDDIKSLLTAIKSVIECDIIILTGGVSAGDADFVPEALKKCGVEEIFHKVKIKPGKPIWFGKHPNGLRVFALPGNPFSVQVACKIFIEPYFCSCFGLLHVHPLSIPISIERKKRVIFDEFFPASLSNENGLKVVPISFNGSGDISAVLNSAGIIRHSSAANDLTKGERVEFYPWKNIS